MFVIIGLKKKIRAIFQSVCVSVCFVCSFESFTNLCVVFCVVSSTSCGVCWIGSNNNVLLLCVCLCVIWSGCWLCC